MFGRRAHVMAQAREAEVGAQPVEQRERADAVDRREQPVGDLVADMRQFGRRKMPREFGRRHLVQAQRVAGVEHVGERDFLPPFDRGHVDVVILDQQRELLDQIIAEHARAWSR